MWRHFTLRITQISQKSAHNFLSYCCSQVAASLLECSVSALCSEMWTVCVCVKTSVETQCNRFSVIIVTFVATFIRGWVFIKTNTRNRCHLVTLPHNYEYTVTSSVVWRRRRHKHTAVYNSSRLMTVAMQRRIFGEVWLSTEQTSYVVAAQTSSMSSSLSRSMNSLISWMQRCPISFKFSRRLFCILSSRLGSLLHHTHATVAVNVLHWTRSSLAQTKV